MKDTNNLGKVLFNIFNMTLILAAAVFNIYIIIEVFIIASK